MQLGVTHTSLNHDIVIIDSVVYLSSVAVSKHCCLILMPSAHFCLLFFPIDYPDGQFHSMVSRLIHVVYITYMYNNSVLHITDHKLLAIHVCTCMYLYCDSRNF